MVQFEAAACIPGSSSGEQLSLHVCLRLDSTDAAPTTKETQRVVPPNKDQPYVPLLVPAKNKRNNYTVRQPCIFFEKSQIARHAWHLVAG